MENKNANKPAFPISPYPELEADIKRGYPLGLTKREYFAAMAMQGMCANNGYSNRHSNSAKEIAIKSLEIADALLAQLTTQ